MTDEGVCVSSCESRCSQQAAPRAVAPTAVMVAVEVCLLQPGEELKVMAPFTGLPATGVGVLAMGLTTSVTIVGATWMVPKKLDHT